MYGTIRFTLTVVKSYAILGLAKCLAGQPAQVEVLPRR